MIRVIFCILVLCVSSLSVAQENGGENMMEKYGPRRQISTIVYMGLAGAVLGLSTLSFYGRPQDKLSNIPIGFGVGVIIGTVYMTYQAATNPGEFYRQGEYQPRFTDKNYEDYLASDLLLNRREGPSFSYQWNF